MASESLLLPFYVLADVSWSMTVAPDHGDGVAPLDALNKVVISVKDALDVNPILSDKVRFGLIDFSDDATVQIPLCDLMQVDASQIPTLTARGGTSYAAAFREIKNRIESDVAQLKADGHKVHRPAVFFLTDGQPTDPDSEWQGAFSELVSENFKARPNVIPFGVGDAQKVVLDQVTHGKNMRSFVTDDGRDPADAIRQMAEILISSVIASANSLDAAGSGGGFILDFDEDDEDDPWL